MKHFRCKGLSGISGSARVPGDKSIAHRALILSALSPQVTIIENFPANNDCCATVGSLRALGIKVTGDLRAPDAATITVFGRGLRGLIRPRKPLCIAESGTTFRLLLGVLAGQDFKTRLTAGKALQHRPMKRVAEPLRLMGAHLRAVVRKRNGVSEEYPPVTIQGGNLKAITYRMPVASAQVKSAILLAGLYARGQTTIIEPAMTRDHTERLLKQFGANIKRKANEIVVSACPQLVSPGKIYVPGDISSASFFIVLGCLARRSQVTVKAVTLNPSRMGAIKVLKRMGADIQVRRLASGVTGGEPMGDIRVKSSVLKACTIKKEEIPSLIDELPILMVAASLAQGRSVFEGVEELRVKETDRIASMMMNLKAMGGDIQATRAPVGRQESVIIKGVPFLRGTQVQSFQDHRTAMSMVIAGFCAKGTTDIDDVSCISKSFPGFLKTLKKLTS